MRSVSQRLEGIEDGVDRLDERLAALNSAPGVEQRLASIEDAIDKLAKEVRAIHKALPGTERPVSRNQERLEVAADS